MMARRPCFSSATIILLSIILTVFKTSSPAQGAGDSCGGGGGAAAALFIFGDSYFDPGNNNYINTTTIDQANFWPYGESYFDKPTGRFSNGRLISDFVAEYAGMQLIPPYLEQPENGDFRSGANFASAGAGALVETFRGSVINLNTQFVYYEKVKTKLKQELGGVRARNIISDAVYLFSIGTNDYLSYFLTNSSAANNLTHFSSSLPYFTKYVNMVVGNLSNLVQKIYKKGGRKFGFLNLGELGCLPGLRVLHLESSNGGGGCLEPASLVAKLHNYALYKLLSQLEQQLEGFKYSLGDFNKALRQRIKHPSHFGFKEGRAACCGAGAFKGIFSCGGRRPMVVVNEFELCENPQQHVFWDSYHLTESVYSQMAAEMWNGSSPAGRYNLKALFNF